MGTKCRAGREAVGPPDRYPDLSQKVVGFRPVEEHQALSTDLKVSSPRPRTSPSRSATSTGMKTHAKIAVDRLIGLPLAWLLNGAARILGKLLRRDHTIDGRECADDRDLEVPGDGQHPPGDAPDPVDPCRLSRGQTDLRDGPLVPPDGRAARAHRRQSSRSMIGVCFKSLGRPCARSRPSLARVDLYFDLEIYSAYSSLMALLSLARNRIGFYRESAQHKRGNYTHLMYFNTRSPIRYTYLQLGRLVGCEPVEPNRLGRIRVDSHAIGMKPPASLRCGGRPARLLRDQCRMHRT